MTNIKPLEEKHLVVKNKESYQWWQEDLKEYLSWQYKSCVYHRHVFKHINIPESGSIVMLGTGYGLALEILANQFVHREVVGYDLYNYADHPLVIEEDVANLKDQSIAYVYCNVGNFIETPKIRLIGLKWSLKNLVPGGVCITSGNHPFVEDYLGFKIKDIASEYNCCVENMPYNKEFEKMNNQGKYHSDHDCIIIKQ